MAGYKQTEAGAIPEEWEAIQLGQVAAFVTSGSRGWATYYSTNGALFIRSQNVRAGRLDLGDSQYVNPPSGAEGNRTKVCQHDILITITGNNVGNVALVDQEFNEAYISQHVGLVRLSEPKLGSYITRFLSPGSPGNHQIAASQSGQSKPGLTLQNLKEFWIAIPRRRAEQHAIASALRDVDALLSGLDRLIAKKRDLKQAAMQQLLTGQTRLPGFEGEWEVKRLGNLLTICHGKSQRKVEVEGGAYPILATGGQIGTAKRPLYDKPSVLIGRKGTINQPQYMDTPFWTVDTLFYSAIKDNNSARFLYYRFCLIDWMQYNEASGVPSLNARTIENIEVDCPKPAEQTAIAAVLSDLDAELTVLETRREKTRLLKQGMMQELLTGKTRLITPEPADA